MSTFLNNFWPEKAPINGFTAGLGGDWSDLKAYAKAKQSAAELAAKRALENKNYSTIHGIKRIDKSPVVPRQRVIKEKAPKKFTPRRAVADSMAGRIRTALRTQGPMTHKQLAETTKVPYLSIGGLVMHDVKLGKITHDRTVRPMLFVWVGP